MLALWQRVAPDGDQKAVVERALLGRALIARLRAPPALA